MKPPESVDLSSYLVEALREDVTSLEAELEMLRASLRYRVGELVLQMAVSPMRSGVRTLRRLARLLIGARRRAVGSGGAPLARDLPDAAIKARVVVLGQSLPDSHGLGRELWMTEDVDAVCGMIDAGVVGDRLVLRQAVPALLRRLERARVTGWRVLWWPEPESDQLPALAAYARAHCDESRGNGP
jgi:hypothetical protein